MTVQRWHVGKIALLWITWLLLLPALWFGSPERSAASRGETLHPPGGAPSWSTYQGSFDQFMSERKRVQSWYASPAGRWAVFQHRYNRESAVLLWVAVAMLPLVVTWRWVGGKERGPE